MKNKKAEKTDCCEKDNSKRNKGIATGIIYGLIPHIGCIAFIIGSVLGVTILMQSFKPLLMNHYFFHILILISLMFATLSSFLYLRKNDSVSIDGIKRKWKYLATMYGSTIGINLVLFMLIFPLLANVSLTGAAIYQGNPNDISDLTLQVKIPCPGHAPLISNELKTIQGVYNVEFRFPNYFDFQYSSSTNEQEILGLDVFDTYPATVITNSRNGGEELTQRPANTNSVEGSCGSGCGGSSCGASAGGSCTGGCGS
ncbi:MAG: hypothetical protein KJ767_03860 [Nanoarchaeota archaeon]|nr:hypothetical protein [Nanoarchaeota archaeon]